MCFIVEIKAWMLDDYLLKMLLNLGNQMVCQL